jgi:23S rRNA pseudouridine2605 synthase
MIEAGRVRVNGEGAAAGRRVDPARDRIEVDGETLRPEEPLVHLVLHKPPGYQTTRRDRHARRTVMELVEGVEEWVYPVGRLDADTEGLLLFTNDGELANRLIHPRYGVPKTYHATVEGAPDEPALEALRHGVELEDGITAPAEARLVETGEREAVVELTVHEGRKRQVRRMCAAVGHPVVRLVRVAFGTLELGELEIGRWRRLADEEVEALRAATGEGA